MLRIRTTAAILALSLSTTVAQAVTADNLAARIHDAAVTACAPERVTASPRAHYDAIDQACIYRLSRAAMIRYEALAKAPPKVANN